ncbi:MAG: LL-diaminopimelate aminotransferase [Planctomycetota bacterium]|nr:LL-diaminopimelate aminotransferase [Planctomycetota bacterium]
MALINEHYLKLAGGYLFPEIARRVEIHLSDHPEAADRLIKCGIGDVTEPLPEAVRQAMHRAVDEMGARESFRGYGEPTGYGFLREAIAKGDFQDHGLNIDAEEIFISDGSKTDCSAILDILAVKGANRIGITDPVYPVYVDTNVMCGNTGVAKEDGRYEGLTYLPCTPGNGFVPDVPGDDEPKLDLIYLCYPNNPTGGMITHDQLKAWVEYALKHKAIIFYDVAYQAYITEPNLPRSIYEIDGADRCAIEFHSFSKNGGFTGVRCGYTACPRKLVGWTSDGKEIPLHGLWSRRWSTKSNNVAYIIQRGAEAIYSPEGREQVQGLVDFYLENARILREGCEAMGMDVTGGVNAPYVWIACPDGLSSWDMFDRMLNQANVVITPGVGFGSCGEGFIRISAFNSRENVVEVVNRMKMLSSEKLGV